MWASKTPRSTSPAWLADRYPILTVDTTIELEEGKKLRHSFAATEVTNDSAILHLAAQLIHRKDPQSDC